MKEVTFKSNVRTYRNGTIFFSSNALNLLSPRPMNSKEENAFIQQIATSLFREYNNTCYISRVLQLKNNDRYKVLATNSHQSLFTVDVDLSQLPSTNHDLTIEIKDRSIHHENEALPQSSFFTHIRYHYEKDLTTRLQEFEDLLFTTDCLPQPAALASLESTTEAFQRLYNQAIERDLTVLQTWLQEIDSMYNANVNLHAYSAEDIREIKETFTTYLQTTDSNARALLDLAAQITYIKSELIKALYNAAIACLTHHRESSDIATIKTANDSFMKTFVCIVDIKLCGQTSTLNEAYEKLFDLSFLDLQNFAQKLLARCDTNRFSSTPELTILKKHLEPLNFLTLQRESLFWKISFNLPQSLKDHEKHIREICNSVNFTPAKFITEFVKGLFDKHCKDALSGLQKKTYELKRSIFMKEAEPYRKDVETLEKVVPDLRHQCLQTCIQLIKDSYSLLAFLEEKNLLGHHDLTGKLYQDLILLKQTLKQIEPKFDDYERHIRIFKATFARLQGDTLNSATLTLLSKERQAAYDTYLFLYEHDQNNFPATKERLLALQNRLKISSIRPSFFQAPLPATDLSAQVAQRNPGQSIR